MTFAVWHGLAADKSSGDLVVLPSPTVTVIDKSGGAQPQLFSDRDANTSIGNPFTADADGNITFYAPPGRYRIEATDGTNTVTWDDVEIGAIPSSGPVSLSDLQGIDVSGAQDGDIVYMRGRTTTGDGGEGHFRWDSSNLSTEVGNDEVTTNEGDGGIYVAPSSDKTGASGAWVRQELACIDVRWYGAVLDNSTDDSTALQRSVDRATIEKDYYVFIPGQMVIGSTVTLKNQVRIIGSGREISQITLADNSDTDLFLIDTAGGKVRDVEIQKIKLNGNAANQSSVSTLIDQAGGNGVEDFVVKDCSLVNSYAHGIRLVGSGSPPTNLSIRIQNNEFVDIGEHSCELRSTDETIISNNRYSDWGKTTASKPAIQMQNATKNMSITDNLFISTTGTKFAVEAAGSSAVVNGFAFSGNVLVSTNGAGETGLSGRFNHASIVGNTWRGGGNSNRWGTEIVGHDNVISGNTVENGTIVAVSDDQSGDSQMDNLVIQDNVVSNSGSSKTAISFGRSAAASAAAKGKRILVSNNVLDLTSASNSLIGIRAGQWGAKAELDDVNIIGNVIRGPGSAGDGIAFAAASNSSSWMVALNRIASFTNGIQIPDDNVSAIRLFNNFYDGNTTNVDDSSTSVEIVRLEHLSSNQYHIAPSLLSSSSYRGNAPLIIERNGDNEVQILAGKTNFGQLRFGDEDNDFAGSITYDHSNDHFILKTGGNNTRLTLDANTGFTGGTGSAGSGNQFVELQIGGNRYKLLHDGTV